MGVNCYSRICIWVEAVDLRNFETPFSSSSILLSLARITTLLVAVLLLLRSLPAYQRLPLSAIPLS